VFALDASGAAFASRKPDRLAANPVMFCLGCVAAIIGFLQTAQRLELKCHPNLLVLQR
jgi:hypothetical protein